MCTEKSNNAREPFYETITDAIEDVGNVITDTKKWKSFLRLPFSFAESEAPFAEGEG